MGPSKLDEIMKNKTVALVGNALSLIEHPVDYGPEIDAHDVVIRMNRVVENLNPQKQGTKTNVIFFARPIFNIRELQFDLAIWTCGPEEYRKRTTPYNLHDAISPEKLEFYPQDQRRYMKDCMFEGCFPTTGFIAMQHTIFRDSARLDVYGYDNFTTGSIVTGQNNAWKWHRPDLEKVEINNMIHRNVYLKEQARQQEWLKKSTDSVIQTPPMG